MLARIGRGHRVGPGAARSPATSRARWRRRADRRWLAVAAAAGLVLGVLAGQLPHLRRLPARRDGPVAGPGHRAAEVVGRATDGRPLEDTLLSEVEAALDPDARPELRALDALTPVHYEIR